MNISDLRPHLSNLNWILKDIDKSIEVQVSEDGTILDLQIGKAHEWTETSD